MYLGPLAQVLPQERTIAREQLQRWLSPQSLQGPTVGGSTSKLTHMVVGKIEFFTRYWTENISLSMAVGCKPPLVLCQIGYSIGLLTT